MAEITGLKGNEKPMSWRSLGWGGMRKAKRGHQYLEQLAIPGAYEHTLVHADPQAHLSVGVSFGPDKEMT